MERIVKSMPELLSANLEKIIKPKIKLFQELGMSSEDIAKVISSDPAILHSSLNNKIIPSLSVLNRLFGPNYDLKKCLKTFRWLVTANLESVLVPNIEFLKSCGISMEHILKVVYNHPTLLCKKPEILRESVKKADEMGVNRKCVTFVYAVRVVASTSKENWELKLQALRNLGFSDSDILTMFRWSPYIFGLSVEMVKKTIKLLLETGRFNLSDIAKRPTSLCSSIKRRYEPRLRVLGLLESKNLMKSWPTLKKIQTLTDDEFFEKFVIPYQHELGEAYFPTNSIREKNSNRLLDCDEALVIEQSINK